MEALTLLLSWSALYKRSNGYHQQDGKQQQHHKNHTQIPQHSKEQQQLKEFQQKRRLERQIKKVHIGNLQENVTEKDLIELLYLV